MTNALISFMADDDGNAIADKRIPRCVAPLVALRKHTATTQADAEPSSLGRSGDAEVRSDGRESLQKIRWQ